MGFSVGSRESRALLVFFGGVLILFAFFAVGAYVGRWGGARPEPAARQPAPEPPRGPAEYYLVEVAVVSSEGEADALRDKLRQQYISAYSTRDPANPALFNVYVGPYPQREQADTVRAELAEQGMQPKIVKQR
jgi:cell division septation protein DedD